MDKERAETILRHAINSHAAANPAQKDDLFNALGFMLESTERIQEQLQQIELLVQQLRDGTGNIPPATPGTF